jgi:hypothetical protein
MELMQQYKIELTGLTPLLMHRDNLMFNEKIMEWRMMPENKKKSKAGDDRCPAWGWIGYLYHDGQQVGMDHDNIMTMLREGGTKVSTGHGKETYKKNTQAGIVLDQQQFSLTINNGRAVSMQDIEPLMESGDFAHQIKTVERLGFDLLVKRAVVGRSKHIRVRPRFHNWKLTGSLTVMDQELSGIDESILNLILKQAGSLCGIGDWRPSSPSAGRFGMFVPTVTRVN